MLFNYVTNNASQTKKIGQTLAEKILNKKKKEKKSQVLALQGELGGGKTTFLQGFAKGLGIKERILSPTFVILKKFRLFNQNFKFFYHIDCYRVKKERELLSLGFKEIISDPQNIIAVEWANHIKNILPKEVISIDFNFHNKNKRKIIIQCPNKKRN